MLNERLDGPRVVRTMVFFAGNRATEVVCVLRDRGFRANLDRTSNLWVRTDAPNDVVNQVN